MIDIFNKFRETVLYYSGNTLQSEIAVLKNKLNNTNQKEERNQILQDIKKYEYGIAGEKKIIYELKNSHIPMYILHDLNLEYKEYKAQIDFIIVTKKNYYIIECKNLYGNISIDNKGNFYRINNKTKVGIYNPITQLERHINIIRRYVDDKNNFLGRIIVNKSFNTLYHGIVVLANDNTVVEDRYAPKEVKNKVIRADKLIEYIKKVEKTTDNLSSSEKEIQESCDRILALCKKPQTKETTDAYEMTNKQIIDTNIIEHKQISDNELRNKLKEYRLNKSRELKYKPYFVFNDKTMEDIINKKPVSVTELKQIEGFADKKIEMYGKDIINIINNNN